MKSFFRTCAVLFLALAFPASAQFASFQAVVPVGGGGGGFGGGPNLRAANIYGVPNSVTPASYYTPGIATQAVSTADFYGSDGFYWPRPYKISTMGAEGAAAAALYGNYFWPMTPDHAIGSLGNWKDGQDFKFGFSNDPGVMPRMINNQAAPTCTAGAATLTNIATNPYSTSTTFCGYHLAFINYAPEDTGNIFHWYVEGNDGTAGPGHIMAGTTTNGSPIVTGISDTSKLAVGGGGSAFVTGTGIPASTAVAIVGRQFSGTITNGSATVTGISPTTATITGGGCGGGGDAVYSLLNYAVPINTCVSTVDSPTQITLTKSAVANSAAGFVTDNGTTVTLDKNATANGSPRATTAPARSQPPT